MIRFRLAYHFDRLSTLMVGREKKADPIRRAQHLEFALLSSLDIRYLGAQ